VLSLLPLYLYLSACASSGMISNVCWVQANLQAVWCGAVSLLPLYKGSTKLADAAVVLLCHCCHCNWEWAPPFHFGGLKLHFPPQKWIVPGEAYGFRFYLYLSACASSGMISVKPTSAAAVRG